MNAFYKATGYIAGVAVLAIAGAILVQVVGRLMGVNLFGLVEVATYAMVAATFIALPYTLRTGGHIRIRVAVDRLRGRPRWLVEIACYAVAIFFVVYFSYYAFDLTIDSLKRGARSQGMIAAPLWIPQALMSCGLVLFLVALVHSFIQVLRGRMDLAEGETEAL
jgi:TRAP-type C4-dicarboxylate transport system permease small subunit